MTIHAITGAVLAHVETLTFSETLTLLGTLALPAACAALILGAARRPLPQRVTVRVRNRRR